MIDKKTSRLFTTERINQEYHLFQEWIKNVPLTSIQRDEIESIVGKLVGMAELNTDESLTSISVI